ncbi:hypothetical protein [Cytobacillus praedii]|uniref:Uncharacterized protein n=1 Tax=Cytobacillus praedii TaxID=1742358 RepID=A0A4R1AN58_9BACI|nr:hypothetical protein [Cytobacillus praedii]TCJ01055.1 hypothetical protein E0Y62_25900 [Cytobacillus praedii]
MKYARKSAIVDVEIAQDNGLISTWSGEMPYFKGDVITKNEFGEVNVLTEQIFENYYTPIKKVEVRQSPQLSPFEEQYIAAYANYTGEELSQEEKQEYILAMQEMATNKAF